MFGQKYGTHTLVFFGSPEPPLTLPQALFVPRKMAPIFWKPLVNGPLRCRKRFLFLRKMAPIFLEALNGTRRCREHFFSEKWPLDCGVDSQMDLDLDIFSL